MEDRRVRVVDNRIDNISEEMQSRITEKIYKDVNLERRGNRNRRFEMNRKNREPSLNDMEESHEPEDLDYLQYYPQDVRAAILHSLTAPLPTPLPPFTIDTISYYRRANQPIYQTRIPGNAQLDGHMTYQSLSILAHIDQSKYGNYLALVKEFQRDLPLYLSANSKDIREMAVIAAGNKILGREKDVLNLVAANPENLWVLVNHVYQSKISYKHLFPHLCAGRELAFKALYLMSNMKGDESIVDMSDNDDILDRLIEYMHSPNVEIQRNSIRIIGNIIGEGEDYVEIFEKFKLTDNFFKLLLVKDETTLKDVCWLISNYSSTNSSATSVIRNPLIRGRLMDLLYAEKGIAIKKEIIHIFNYIAHYANKTQAFQYLVNEQLLNICHSYLLLQDAEINIVSLHLINGLLQLGAAFPNEHGQNIVLIMVDSMFELRCEVERRSESENTEMSGVAFEILGILRGESEDML